MSVLFNGLLKSVRKLPLRRLPSKCHLHSSNANNSRPINASLSSWKALWKDKSSLAFHPRPVGTFISVTARLHYSIRYFK